MQKEGAGAEVIEFYDNTGQWLLGFTDGPGKLKAGLVIAPGAESPIPQIGFLRGTPNVQQALDLITDSFPSGTGSFRPFQTDPMYPMVLAAAERKFRTADDPLDLKHFDIAEVEASAPSPSGGQQFVVQVGIHNFCLACGVGIAARYTLEFDAEGKFVAAKLAGMCQGRQVTQDVQGIGRATFHDFSGVKPGRSGVTEPYLLEVPGLPTCPEHVAF
jgi:hypothetical protein